VCKCVLPPANNQTAVNKYIKFLYWNFEHVEIKMYAAGYSETSRRVYQTSQGRTLEDLSAEGMQFESRKPGD